MSPTKHIRKYLRTQDRDKFVLTDRGVARIRDIKYIDTSDIEHQKVSISIRGQKERETLTGIAALELVWRLKPSALEGNSKIRWARHAWIVHNILAHPIMQVLAFFRLYNAAMWVHDATVPKPIGYK